MALEDIIAEGKRDLGFVLSEAEFGRSRDEITIASGAGLLAPGTVLGRIAASGKFTPATDAADDGSETAVAVLGYATDARAEDAPAVAITRAAQVKQPELVIADGATETNMIAALADAGIIAR